MKQGSLPYLLLLPATLFLCVFFESPIPFGKKYVCKFLPLEMVLFPSNPYVVSQAT